MARLRAIAQYQMNSLGYYSLLLRLRALAGMNLVRFVNLTRSLIEWKMKTLVSKARPSVIRLEPSAVCNLKCPGCTTPKKIFQPSQVRLMTLATFERIQKEVRAHACRMTFYMEGEPTTNPHLFTMIKMATKHRIFTSFSTNFTLMRERWLKPLFDSRLDYISVALDGFSQHAYEQYRINGDVSKVKDGLRMMMDYKRAGRYDRPFVNVYSITFKHVIPEMEQIKRFCHEIGVDQLTFRPDERPDPTNVEGSALPQPAKPLGNCFWPWLTLNVDVDGSVYPCPIAIQRSERQPYGNLNENSLDEIWNNQWFVETRRYISGKNNGAKDRSVADKLPCLSCPWYRKHVDPSAR